MEYLQEGRVVGNAKLSLSEEEPARGRVGVT